MNEFKLKECTLCQKLLKKDQIAHANRSFEHYKINCSKCGCYLITWMAAYHAIRRKRNNLSRECKQLSDNGRVAVVGTSSGNSLGIIRIEGDDFYLVEELADKLRVNKMTIYRWIKAGKLRASKIGKEYRIARSDFERLINQTIKK
jgi:excisionase family DNA binding protein